MIQRRGYKLCVILAIVLGVTAKPPPSVISSQWTSYAGKPAYSRSLGSSPVPGVGTITVPYIPKPSIFPKFVDPKTMISKKMDLMSNLFGGLGPADSFGSAGDTSYYSKLGATDTPEKYQSSIPDNTVAYKRGIFGPVVSPFAPVNPFAPDSSSKFSMMGTKFPYGGMRSTLDTDVYDSSDFSTRRKRSLDASSATNDMENYLRDSGSQTTQESTSSKERGPPPPYSGLETITEEPEASETTPLLKLFGPPFSTGGTGFIPGTFGPVGPVVDPGMFIAKKTAFLDTLFKTLATSTPSPMTTEAPTQKSTIVPPNFWFPSSAIPGPSEYSQKVSDFLNKLFDSMSLNLDLNGTSSDDTGASSIKVTRSIDDLTTITAAKDAIVESILSELGTIKGSMISTLNDLITYEKTVASATASVKKPFKPFAPGLWPAPTVDATLPFQQRMNVLGQVFDMLTDLQKNITTAVQEAVKAKTASTDDLTASEDFIHTSDGEGLYNVPIPSPEALNQNLLDAIKTKLASINVPGSVGVPSSGYGFVPKKVARTLGNSPTSFWIHSSAASKREVPEVGDHSFSEDRRNEYSRAVDMQMHQGYQSMPPGTVESVQAGGGSVPGHQGGGIKLFDTEEDDIARKWADWEDHMKKQYHDNRHHHNHH